MKILIKTQKRKIENHEEKLEDHKPESFLQVENHVFDKLVQISLEVVVE